MPTEPQPTTSSRRRTTRVAAAMGVAAILLSACVTGERPSLVPAPEVDDAAANVVLTRLDRAESVPFTATFDIIPSTTGEPTEATVSQADGRRRVTIGDIEYRIADGVSQTCRLSDGTCVDGIDDAPISNLNVTHRFWGESAAGRLTIDASRRVGFSEGSTESIAGRSAACTDVPVLGGTVVYCALDAGVLARYFGADVTIELTSFSSEVDDPAVVGDADF